MYSEPLSPARHEAYAATPPWRLLLGLAGRLRWSYLAHVPSNYALAILRRKYDAVTTDAAYENRPSSWLGPIGRAADRRVLNYPLHVALRGRLAHVTQELSDELSPALSRGDRPSLLSAPCGLARDLTQTIERLRERGLPADDVELHCLDIDRRGDVIPGARRRLEAAGVAARYYREDLFASPALDAKRATGGFHVINCIGLAAWLPLADLERLLARFAQLTRPGGLLLIDTFARHAHSTMADELEMHVWYHTPATLRAALRDAGFDVQRERTTDNGVNTLLAARRKA